MSREKEKERDTGSEACARARKERAHMFTSSCPRNFYAGRTLRAGMKGTDMASMDTIIDKMEMRAIMKMRKWSVTPTYVAVAVDTI